MNRPAWMPTPSDIERDVVKTLCTMVVLAVLLREVPALRRFFHSALNP